MTALAPQDHKNATLPIVDLRLANDPVRAEEFQDQLRVATRDFGFFYLVGHGIPRELSTRLIDVAQQFFALPDEDKLTIEKIHSKHYRGYSRVGDEFT